MNKLRGTHPATRLRRSNEGTTALEFAMVAPMLLFGILFVFQVAYGLFAQEALDVVTMRVTRSLITGASLNQAGDSTSFMNNVACPSFSRLLDCTRMSVSVKAVGSYDDASLYDDPVVGVPDQSRSAYVNPQPRQKLLVTASYALPVFVPSFFAALAGYDNGSSINLYARSAVITEDFDPAQPGVTP